jgi:hypothetical protein
LLQLFGGSFSRKASRKTVDVSFPETRLRVAFSSSAREAPDQYCCLGRAPAKFLSYEFMVGVPHDDCAQHEQRAKDGLLGQCPDTGSRAFDAGSIVGFKLLPSSSLNPSAASE